jgi:hypothetical protein
VNLHKKGERGNRMYRVPNRLVGMFQVRNRQVKVRLVGMFQVRNRQVKVRLVGMFQVRYRLFGDVSS